MRMRLLALLTLSVAVLGSVLGASAQDATPMPIEGLSGSTWRLVSLGAPGGEVLLEQDSEITLRFGPEGALEGHGGCNNYSGTATTNAVGTITISQIASTRMACENDAITAQEISYLTALENAVQYRLSGDRLMIWTEDGRQLNFTATGAYALLNSQWQLTAMGTAGAPAEIAADTVVTLEFPTAQEIAGYGGCNGYTGTYQADDDNIGFSEVIATLMACEDSTVMDQEIAYFDLLPLMTQYEIGDGQLTLTSEDGLQQMQFVPSGAYALRRTRWQLSGFTSGGESMTPLESAPITLEFSTQTDVGGSGGCNSFGGMYTVEDDSITFGELASTLMACLDEAVMDQEAWFFETLALVERYEIAEGQLILHTPDGQMKFSPVSSPVVPGAA
jgi:heat shock protein HslJ